MKASYGFDQCYNGQIAVDEAAQLIVATGLTNCAADTAELLPLIDRTHATLGGDPPEVLADAGYRSEATFQTLEARGITAYISLGHEVRPGKPPNPAHRATQRMAARLASDAGRARYRRRKAIVEPVLGWIKRSPRLPPLHDARSGEGPRRVEHRLSRRQREALTSTRNSLNEVARVGAARRPRFPEHYSIMQVIAARSSAGTGVSRPGHNVSAARAPRND